MSLISEFGRHLSDSEEPSLHSPIYEIYLVALTFNFSLADFCVNANGDCVLVRVHDMPAFLSAWAESTGHKCKGWNTVYKRLYRSGFRNVKGQMYRMVLPLKKYLSNLSDKPRQTKPKRKRKMSTPPFVDPTIRKPVKLDAEADENERHYSLWHNGEFYQAGMDAWLRELDK